MTFQDQLAAFDTLVTNGMTAPSLVMPASLTTPTVIPSNIPPVMGGLGSGASTIPNIATGALKGIVTTQITAFILGVICIIGAIFLFHGPAIIQTTKTVAKHAAEISVAAA